jgi:hypothetical protein
VGEVCYLEKFWSLSHGGGVKQEFFRLSLMACSGEGMKNFRVSLIEKKF